MRARSFECCQPSPTSDQERFRMKQKAWTNDRCLILTKEQQAALAKDDFEIISHDKEKSFTKVEIG